MRFVILALDEISNHFAPQPLYSGEENRRYPLTRRLEQPQSRSDLDGEEKSLCYLPLKK
jgi:hypothetical protein